MPYADPEKRRENSRQYRVDHPDLDRERYQRSRDSVLAKNTKWRAANREKVAVGKLAWQQANPAKMHATGKKGREKLRAEMVAAYGSACACCGETEPLFLTLDHVNGGGNEERRLHKQRSNESIVRKLRRLGWPQDGYRLLCWNCQFGTLNGRVCPHQVTAV